MYDKSCEITSFYTKIGFIAQKKVGDFIGGTLHDGETLCDGGIMENLEWGLLKNVCFW